ncbi:MAG TPA: hypothetical protein VLS93_15945, partial [Anaeromyxobacteraceae bacterium]|nr:hypothetical protein [Anaeromyxobacteraceae bacterium]
PAATGTGPDVIFFADGGRARGTVVEETASGGVLLRLLDGSTRRYAPGQVVRIEYSDGTVSSPAPRTATPAAPPYGPPSAPPYGPPSAPPYGPPSAPPYGPPAPRPPPSPSWPPPQPAPHMAAPGHAGMGPLSPVYFAFGMGGSGLAGEAEGGVDMSDVSRGQMAMLLETGVRVSPAVALGLYLDLGVGDAGPAFASTCNMTGMDCGAVSVRIGGLVRHTWDPVGRTSPWIAIGTGFELLDIHADDGFGTSDVVYTGWEMLRVTGGVDLRTNALFGVGLYGGIAFGTFSSVEDPTGTYDITDQSFHTTVTAGLRFTLFP